MFNNTTSLIVTHYCSSHTPTLGANQVSRCVALSRLSLLFVSVCRRDEDKPLRSINVILDGRKIPGGARLSLYWAPPHTALQKVHGAQPTRAGSENFPFVLHSSAIQIPARIL